VTSDGTLPKFLWNCFLTLAVQVPVLEPVPDLCRFHSSTSGSSSGTGTFPSMMVTL